MPQGSGQTTKKVVKWCVRELPGYSLEFPKAFLMAATNFFFILSFWSMLLLCEVEIRLMSN